MARLRGGNANTARGAGHFLRETIGRVRSRRRDGPADGPGRLAASTPTPSWRSAAKLDVRFCITVRQHRGAQARSSRRSPRRPGRPSRTGSRAAPTWPRRRTPRSRARRTRGPVRLIVRRVRPTPGSQLALLHASTTTTPSSPTATATTLELEADHRRHAEIENAIRDLKYGVGLNHLPSGRFAANGAWLAVQVIAHNLARWTARIGLGEGIVTTKTLRRRLFGLAGRLTRSARRVTLHLPARWPWADRVRRRARAAPGDPAPRLTAR